MSNTHKIQIEDIENTSAQALNISFEDYIEDINSKTPVKAELTAKILGDYIEVTGHGSVTVELECDRCLSTFDLELDFELEETFAKNSLLSEYGQETELKSGQFITDLNNANEIDIYDLLYQSVIINLPNKKVCGINCNERIFATDETYNEPDSRMEVFKNIKIDK